MGEIRGFGIPFACFLATTLLIMSAMPCHAQLSSTFYDSTCPTALTTIRTAVRDAVSDERRAAAWFLRIHFHDCFVQGCDASVLIDPSSSSTNERNSTQNFRSIRGLELIDSIKSEVEKVCPGVVSCSDILAVAARDASVEVGGPTWTVKLGRRDSTSAASQDQAQADIPIFSDNLDTIISKFSRVGLSARDMVALSGAHTIGQAQCVTFRDRIYNATNIDDDFASTRRDNCPSGDDGNTNLAPLDLETPNSFDNNYFKNLLDRKGLLASDQVLFNGGSTDDIVTEYSKDGETFNSDFAAAMVKMGDISPLTGSSGQIRRVCNVVS